MKRSTKVTLVSLATVSILGIGGVIMGLDKYDEVRRIFNGDEPVASSSQKETKQEQDDEETVKKKQVAYLKEHEQEIVDFVKAQSSKVESVQVDWTDVRWSDSGLFESEYYINVYGRVNNIEDSGWGVDIPLNDDGTVNMDEMSMGDYINIGGEPV